MGSFDLSTEHGARTEQHLTNDQVVWLTTVGTNGVPQPSPVWFHWDNGSVVIHSQPNTPKVRAIAANPNVALNFNCGPGGDDVVVIRGTATLENPGAVSPTSEGFAAKYADGIAHLGMTAETFAAEYSQKIRIEPTGLRGF